VVQAFSPLGEMQAASLRHTSFYAVTCRLKACTTNHFATASDPVARFVRQEPVIESRVGIIFRPYEMPLAGNDRRLGITAGGFDGGDHFRVSLGAAPPKSKAPTIDHVAIDLSLAAPSVSSVSAAMGAMAAKRSELPSTAARCPCRHTEPGHVDAGRIGANFRCHIIQEREHGLEHDGLVPSLSARRALRTNQYEREFFGERRAAPWRWQFHRRAVGKNGIAVGTCLAGPVQKHSAPGSDPWMSHTLRANRARRPCHLLGPVGSWTSVRNFSR